MSEEKLFYLGTYTLLGRPYTMYLHCPRTFPPIEARIEMLIGEESAFLPMSRVVKELFAYLLPLSLLHPGKEPQNDHE